MPVNDVFNEDDGGRRRRLVTRGRVHNIIVGLGRASRLFLENVTVHKP